MSMITKELAQTFHEMKWSRYLEEKSKKVSPTDTNTRKITFFFNNGVSSSFYLNEEQYKEWRLVLDKLVVINNER